MHLFVRYYKLVSINARNVKLVNYKQCHTGMLCATLTGDSPSQLYEQAAVIYVLSVSSVVSIKGHRLYPYIPQNKDSFFTISGDFEGLLFVHSL